MSVGEFIRTQMAGPLGADVFVGLGEREQARTVETIPLSPLGYFIFQAALSLGGRTKSLAFMNRHGPQERPTRLGGAKRKSPPPMDMRAPVAWRGYIPCWPGRQSRRSAFALRSERGTRRSWEQVHAKMWRRELLKGARLGLCCLPRNSATPPADGLWSSRHGWFPRLRDPAKRLAMGYVMNKMIFGLDTRYINLCRAVYSCLNRDSQPGSCETNRKK